MVKALIVAMLTQDSTTFAKQGMQVRTVQLASSFQNTTSWLAYGCWALSLQLAQSPLNRDLGNPDACK